LMLFSSLSTTTLGRLKISTTSSAALKNKMILVLSIIPNWTAKIEDHFNKRKYERN